MEEPKDMFKGKNVDINILKLVDVIDYCQCVCLPFVVCLLFVYCYTDITKLMTSEGLGLIDRFTKELKILSMSLQ